jgi:hypothetical protein
MAKEKNVFEILDAWGEWERCGSNVLKHLQSKSSLGVWLDSVTTTRRSFAPSMSDDEALMFGRVMLALKTNRPGQYQVLFLVHVERCSMRDVASKLNINRVLAAKIYERAIGWVECCFDIQDAA